MGETEISGNTFNGGFPTILFMTYDGRGCHHAAEGQWQYHRYERCRRWHRCCRNGCEPRHLLCGNQKDRQIRQFRDLEQHDDWLARCELQGHQHRGEQPGWVAGGFGSLRIFGNTISGTDGKGIQLYGHITGAEVHDNILTGLYQGVKGFTYESTFYPEGNTIYHNQITGASNLLVDWEGTGTFNVEENWWGSSAGPEAGKMSINVDYAPWCTDAACTQLSSTAVSQWASGATASSEYTYTSWGAVQATGAPNTNSCGDQSTAWSPEDFRRWS